MIVEHSERIRSLWRTVTSCPTGFGTTDVLVEDAPQHRAAPPGWVGIVELFGQVVIAAPSADVGWISHNLRHSTAVDALTDIESAIALLGPFSGVLGPARLWYGPPATTVDTVECSIVGPVPLDDDRVVQALRRTTEEERDESAIDETTSGIWVSIGRDGQPGALCGWREWPERVAHVSVISSSTSRRRGLAAAAARRALTAAWEDDLIPQWRAADVNLGSNALAEHLGLALVGSQLSVCLAVR